MGRSELPTPAEVVGDLDAALQRTHSFDKAFAQVASPPEVIGQNDEPSIASELFAALDAAHQDFGGVLFPATQRKVVDTVTNKPPELEDEVFNRLAGTYLRGFFKHGAMPYGQHDARRLIESLREIRRIDSPQRSRVSEAAEYYSKFTSRSMADAALKKLNEATDQEQEANFGPDFWNDVYNVCITAAEIEGI